MLSRCLQAHQQLEGLDSMVRELRQLGNIELMVDALAHLQHKQQVAEEDKRALASRDAAEL